MASIEFRNISKIFPDGTVALKNLNLQVNDGELVVLVGASGCGKSTALRLLAGLETPSEGEVLIDNRVVNLNTPQQRNIAMVFQNYALYPHMTVRGNLQFPLKMSHIPQNKIASRVTEIAELLGLSDLLERKPAQLSGGQRQRVAMGRALVRDPSVFLLDEPLSNLDAKLRAQIRADIAEIQKSLHKTTIYVTHDQVEAMTLGDRVAVLVGGKLQQIGTPEQLYNNPQSIFIAQFIGSPGMNIFSSELVTSGDHQLVLRLAGQEKEIHPTSTSVKDALANYIGQSLYIGIRPESLLLESFNNALQLQAKVKSMEYLGHESLVYLDFSEPVTERYGDEIIARLPGSIGVKENETIELYVDADNLCFFDSQGLNILR